MRFPGGPQRRAALSTLGLVTALAVACSSDEGGEGGGDGGPGDADGSVAPGTGGVSPGAGGAPASGGGSVGGAVGSPTGGASSSGGAPGGGGAAASDAGPIGTSCDPRQIQCRRAPPVCDEGDVPSVVGTCYGDCVPIDECVCSEPAACPDEGQYTCHNFRQRCGPYVS